MRNLILTKEASKTLRKLKQSNPKQARIIASRIMALQEDPNPPESKGLAGSLHSYYRLRCGDYRILYRCDADSIHIAIIGHRREIYEIAGRKLPS